MNSNAISRLLHDTLKTHYKVRVGDSVSIDFPRVPLTADTEFLQLKMEIDNPGAFVKEFENDKGEGTLLPHAFVGRAAKPGRSTIRVRAFDALSRAEIDGVSPLEIVVDAE